jgi:hypothetical protein
MSTMTWGKLGVGTMQSMPEPNFCYQILKFRDVLHTGEQVITYQVVKLTETDWLHIGAADMFAEAKEIAARDYAQTA